MVDINDTYGKIKERVVSMVTRDPGLPRPQPSITFWQEPPHPLSAVQSEQLPKNVDYAIIGSGITGCSVANTLLNHGALPNKRIAVFEARTLTSGATGRNGGHLVSPSAAEFAMTAAKFGIENAAEVARFTFRNIDRVYELVSSLDKSVQEASEIRKVTAVVNFLDAASYEYFQESLRQFQEACPELAARINLLNAEDAKKKYNFAESEGAFEQPAGALWPYRLVTEIFAKLLHEHRSRFSIDTHTPITKVSYEAAKAPYPYRLETPRGAVDAAQVVYCINGFTSHLLPQLCRRIFPLRGTVTAQKLLPEAPNEGANYSWSFVHEPSFDPDTGIASVGLYYMTQNAKTGDFILGGEKQKYDEMLVSDDTVIPSLPANTLVDLMPKLFRSPVDEEYTTTAKRIWSGIMGFIVDSMPLVGRLGKGCTGNSGDGEFIAAGFNGHGMDKCWLIGETLGAMIAGEDVNGRLPSLYQVTDRRLLESMVPSKVPEELFHL